MSRSSISEEIKARIRHQAKDQCGYCHRGASHPSTGSGQAFANRERDSSLRSE